MDRSLNTLADSFKPRAIEFLARLVEAGIPVIITNTIRTQQEQQDALANGTSWVQHSKHQSGLAIDVCPYEIFNLHGPDKLQWNNDDPVWQRIGSIGKALGLRWGGDWQVKDMGHFEQMT